MHPKPLIVRLRLVNRAIRHWREIYVEAKEDLLPDRKRRARRTIRKLKAQRRRLKAVAAKRQGTTSVIVYEVIPFVKAFTGAPVTSRKRWATYGNPSSDHYLGNTDADAVDFGIGNAFQTAQRLRELLTGDKNAIHVDYQEFYITRTLPGGVKARFRVQIIAGTHGTGPHLHVGVKRVG